MNAHTTHLKFPIHHKRRLPDINPGAVRYLFREPHVEALQDGHQYVYVHAKIT